MNILYFSEGYTPHDFRFLSAFLSEGHTVRHITLSHKTTEDRRTNAEREVLLPQDTITKSVFSLFTTYKKIKKISDSWKHDLSIAGPIPSVLLPVSLARKAPLVAMSWGSDMLIEFDKSILSRVRSHIALRRADLLFGDCHIVTERLKRLSGKRTSDTFTMPWGVDLELIQSIPGAWKRRDELGWKNNCVLISTRNWEEHYQIPLLLRSFHESLKKYPDARLFLLGDGSQRDEIQKYIKDNKLEPYVNTPASLNNSEVLKYLKAADLYITTSICDGSSISLLEAMACSLPAIGLNAYGNREWIKEGVTGWLFNKMSIHGVTNVLEKSLREREKWKNLGEAGKSIILERANWKYNFRQFISTCKKLVK